MNCRRWRKSRRQGPGSRGAQRAPNPVSRKLGNARSRGVERAPLRQTRDKGLGAGGGSGRSQGPRGDGAGPSGAVMDGDVRQDRSAIKRLSFRLWSDSMTGNGNGTRYTLWQLALLPCEHGQAGPGGSWGMWNHQGLRPLCPAALAPSPYLPQGPVQLLVLQPSYRFPRRGGLPRIPYCTLPVSHWPEPGQLAAPDCKVGWEM